MGLRQPQLSSAGRRCEQCLGEARRRARWSPWAGLCARGDRWAAFRRFKSQCYRTPTQHPSDSAHLEVRQPSCLKKKPAARKIHRDCRGMRAVSYRQEDVEVWRLFHYFPFCWCSLTVWMHSPRETRLGGVRGCSSPVCCPALSRTQSSNGTTVPQ